LGATRYFLDIFLWNLGGENVAHEVSEFVDNGEGLYLKGERRAFDHGLGLLVGCFVEAEDDDSRIADSRLHVVFVNLADAFGNNLELYASVLDLGEFVPHAFERSDHVSFDDKRNNGNLRYFVLRAKHSNCLSNLHIWFDGLMYGRVFGGHLFGVLFGLHGHEWGAACG